MNKFGFKLLIDLAPYTIDHFHNIEVWKFFISVLPAYLNSKPQFILHPAETTSVRLLVSRPRGG